MAKKRVNPKPPGGPFAGKTATRTSPFAGPTATRTSPFKGKTATRTAPFKGNGAKPDQPRGMGTRDGKPPSGKLPASRPKINLAKPDRPKQTKPAATTAAPPSGGGRGGAPAGPGALTEPPPRQTTRAGSSSGYAAAPPARPGQDARLVRREIMATLSPLIAQINRAYDAQARVGGGAIAGYTNQLANQLGGYEARAADIYGDAAAQQQTADSALVSALRTGSMDQANALGEQLRSAGLDISADQMAPQAQQVGSGAAGALQGTGSASLSQLLAEGASARNYAAGLPGLARLGGQQGIRDLRLSTQRERADELGQLRSQIPGLVQQGVKDLRTSRAEEADRQLRARIFAQEFGLDQAKAGQDAAEAADRSALQWAKLGQDQRQWLGKMKLDAVKVAQGERKLRLSQKDGGFSAKERRDMQADVAESVRDGWTQGITYQQMMRDMLDAGYPLTIIQRVLNSRYRPNAPGAQVAYVNGPEKGFVYFPDRGEKPGTGRPLVPFQLRSKR